MADYNISKALPDDADAIVQFQMAMAMETEGVTLDRESVQQGVSAVMKDELRGVYIVAKAGAATIGSLMITREWSDWTNRWYWWVQSVYVLPDYRKKGVFKTLYSCVKELAKEAGVSKVRLYVDRGNRLAQTAYEKLGMAECHYLMYEEEL